MPNEADEKEFNLFDDLRAAIRGSGLSVSKLSRMCDLNPAQIFRFLSGDSGLNTTSIDKICRALKLRLVSTMMPKADRPTPPRLPAGVASKQRRKRGKA